MNCVTLRCMNPSCARVSSHDKLPYAYLESSPFLICRMKSFQTPHHLPHLLIPYERYGVWNRPYKEREYTKTVYSVEGALWLPTQTSNILLLFISEQLTRFDAGIIDLKVSFCDILSQCFREISMKYKLLASKRKLTPSPHTAAYVGQKCLRDFCCFNNFE